MIDQTNRFALRNRYLFKGRLVMRTAFHIGGGKGIDTGRTTIHSRFQLQRRIA